MFALGLYSCRLVHHHLTTKKSARPMVLSSRTKPLSFAIRVEEEDAEPAAASMPDAQQPSVLPAGASAPSIVKPTASEPVATHATYKGKRLSKENITAADGYEKAETLVDSMIEKGEVVAVMPFGWAVDNAASQLAGAEAERQLRQALKEIAALRAEIAALKEENAALQEESLKELKADLDEQEVDAAAGALVGDVIAAAVKEVHDDKIDASAELLACGAISGALEELKMEQVDAAAGLLADGAIAAALEDIKMQEVDAAAGLLADGAIADAVRELQEAAAAAAAITAVKEEEKKEEPVRLLLPVDAAEAKDQSSPKVSAGALSSFKPAAAAGRLLRHSLSIEDVPEPIPTIVHEQSWVAENINWHEEVAVGGVVVRTPPGLRRMVSSSSSAGSSFNVGGSSGGLESQVSLSPESSEVSIKSSSSSTLGSLGRRGSSSCSSDDLGDFWSWPDAKQVGRSFSWTEKLIKRPDPVPDRFLPVSRARPTMVPRGAGEARAQSLAAAARESSSIIRAMKSEAAAAARAWAAAAAAAARKQPSSATQQRRARKAATN